MTSFRRALAAAVLATAAVGAGSLIDAPAASAAACGTSSGVTVVVDFGSLGGGVQASCLSDGGGQRASSLFQSAGFGLTPVQSQPGFVCRINGLPSPDKEPCVNTPPEDAYWGLWWSDAGSGSWTYSSLGASSLKVPDGGYVGFAWQIGSKNAPNLSPAPHVSTPTPTVAPTPTTAPTSASGGGHHGGNHGGGGHSSATPTVKPSTKPTHTTSSAAPTPTVTSSGSVSSVSASPDDTNASTGPTAAPTTGPSSPPSPATPSATAPTEAATSGTSDSTTPSDSTSVAPQADPGSPADTGGALPAWVVPVVIVLLVLVGVAIALLRRRHLPSP